MTFFYSMRIKIFLKNRPFTKLLLVGTIFFIWALPTEADDIQVSASVDNSEITLEDSLLLSVRVQGVMRAPSPELPNLQDFKVRTQKSNTSLSIINGKKASSFPFNYVLTPTKLA